MSENKLAKRSAAPSADKSISFATCFQVTIIGIKNALVQGIPFLYARNSALNRLLFVLVALVYICALAKDGRRFLRIRSLSFFIAAFSAFFMMLSAFLFPGNGKVIMSWMPRMLPYCFITFLMISELRTLEWIEHYMTRFSYIIIIFSLLSAFYIHKIGHITMSAWSTYSMPLSYTAMIAVMWLLFTFFQNWSIAAAIFAAIGLLVIITYGSRNPLLAISSYIVIQTFRYARSMKVPKRKRLLYFAVSVLFAFCLIFWRMVVSLLVNLLSIFTLKSRTLSLLSESKVSLTGRDVIHAKMFSLLSQHPITGVGIGGDENLIHESAHGLYLGILVNFGYILGIVIIAFILVLSFIAFSKAKGIDKDIVLLYVCLVLPRGFTGGDLWTSDVFWWMMGICIVVLYSAKAVRTGDSFS